MSTISRRRLLIQCLTAFSHEVVPRTFVASAADTKTWKCLQERRALDFPARKLLVLKIATEVVSQNMPKSICARNGSIGIPLNSLQLHNTGEMRVPVKAEIYGSAEGGVSNFAGCLEAQRGIVR
eukprot:768932-Amphidinium_carterae.1